MGQTLCNSLVIYLSGSIPVSGISVMVILHLMMKNKMEFLSHTCWWELPDIHSVGSIISDLYYPDSIVELVSLPPPGWEKSYYRVNILTCVWRSLVRGNLLQKNITCPSCIQNYQSLWVYIFINCFYSWLISILSNWASSHFVCFIKLTALISGDNFIKT